jgi:DNA-binding protein H-NS
MAKKKPIDRLTAVELYELARERERQEMEEQREAARAQIEEIKERRRELIAQHRKELAAIDREMRQLGGRTRSSRAQAGGKISEQVVDTIASAGRINTKDLKVQLDERGVETKNLNQMLAYLKRNGRVVSPQRGIYAVAK